MMKILGHQGKIAAVAFGVLFSTALFAGNEDRAGQAGASHLLINPWARSSSWGGANSANQRGLEGQFMNVAGLAFTSKTEILFANTQWLAGSGISINAFGLAQRLGKSAGVLGLTITSMSFGDIPITTTQNPEGTGAFYSPRFLNIGVSYAKSFSDKIHGGITLRVINESIANVSASGICLDAGVQYQTSIGKGELKKDNFVFGIALKNIGPKLRYNGDGLSSGAILPTGAELTVDQRSSDFEMPALLNIGVMYRGRFTKDHVVSTAFNFTTNSFTRDQFILGLEYSWKDIIMLRGGYTFEKGIFSSDRSALNTNLYTAFTGPSAGASVDIPLGKNKNDNEKPKVKFGLDYAFRATYAFQGVHTIGGRITL
jgi:hypothetical protein